VYELFCVKPPKDSIIISFEPGPIDNPWWYESDLQKDWDWWKDRDLDEWEHIYLGQPRKQGQYAVLNRVKIRASMNREIRAEGAIEIGVDVARFGDDRTVMYRRHGLKITDTKSFVGQDTMRTAKEAWSLAEYKPFVPIKVDDTGVGGGVTDRLRELGAKVIPVDNGGNAVDGNKYTSAADEMWFEFPIDECDIPCDNELMKQLSGRRYDYDNKGRRKIESKKDFKKRLGYSPDDADALLLCFYSGGNIQISDKTRRELAQRRLRR
jgi:phage terminase large subunit